MSIVALIRIESVKRAVRKAVLRERLIKLLFDLGFAFQLAKNLQESSAARLPRNRCDELREALNSFQQELAFSIEERYLIQVAIAELRIPPENDERVKLRIRTLVDFLSSLKNRIADQLQETE